MVFLSRIYTKTGDRGETGLGDGTRVPKDHPRVTAYGSVDELNAALGLLLAHHPAGPDYADLAGLLQSIQNDLFDVGADLCVPPAPDEQPGQRLRVRPEQARRLEAAIDRWNERLAPLRSFVLPGGAAAAAWCHLARTVCRRAERDAVTLTRARAPGGGFLPSPACPTCCSCWPASTTATAGRTCCGCRERRWTVDGERWTVDGKDMDFPVFSVRRSPSTVHHYIRLTRSRR